MRYFAGNLRHIIIMEQIAVKTSKKAEKSTPEKKSKYTLFWEERKRLGLGPVIEIVNMRAILK
jgi:hypothetical protein